MFRAAVLSPLLLMACGPGPTPDPVDTDPSEASPYTYDDDDDDVTGIPNDDEASLILFVTPPNFGQTNTTAALGGVFVETRRGYVNLAQCVAYQADAFCAPALPDVPDDYVVVEDFVDSLLDELLARDVGPEVNLGGYVAPALQVGALRAYYAPTLATVPQPGDSLDLTFGPGDWGEVSLPDVIQVPDAIGVTSPAIDAWNTFASSEPVPLRWTPGTTGEVYLAVMTPWQKRLYLLEDDGEFDLDLSSFGLVDLDEVELTLSRWTTEDVDIDGHELALQVHHDQWIYGSYRDLGGRTELVPPDTCGDAASAAPILPGTYWGDIQSYTNDLSPLASGCTSWSATGQDAIIPYTLQPGEFLTTRLSFPSDNASIYIVTDCSDTSSCIAGADAVGQGSIETATYHNQSADPLDAYIVVDSRGQNTDVFLLDVESVVIQSDLLVDTCVEAMNQGPAAPGVYDGDLSFFNNILDPGASCGPSSPGGEGLVQVLLQSGETLDATVSMPGSETTLYVLYNCSVAESCAASADVYSGGSESISYTNATLGSEIVYLVVDAADLTGQYILDLTIN